MICPTSGAAIMSNFPSTSSTNAYRFGIVECIRNPSPGSTPECLASLRGLVYQKISWALTITQANSLINKMVVPESACSLH